jgi:hypothetical protein
MGCMLLQSGSSQRCSLRYLGRLALASPRISEFSSVHTKPGGPCGLPGSIIHYSIICRLPRCAFATCNASNQIQHFPSSRLQATPLSQSSRRRSFMLSIHEFHPSIWNYSSATLSQLIRISTVMYLFEYFLVFGPRFLLLTSPPPAVYQRRLPLSSVPA